MKRIIARLRARNLATVIAAAIVGVLVIGSGSAYAGHLITSKMIQDGTIQKSDLSKAVKDELNKQGPQGPRGWKGEDGAPGADGAPGKDGENGAPGKDGENGKDGTFGAIYRVANYTQGGGGRATVGCADTVEESKKYTAISGGARVEIRNDQGSVYTTHTEDITSSFPGRMDWSTNTPFPNRLDGWVVYFGDGDAPSVANNGTLEIWALCVPTDDIPVEVRNY